MAAKVTMRYPTDDDMAYVSEHMRRSDILEIEAISGLSPLEAVRQSVMASDRAYCFTACIDGEPVCIGGCSPLGLLSDIGIIWLLGTEQLTRYAKLLTRDCRRGIDAMLDKWPILTNIIDVRSTQTIRWLRLVGFEFKETLVIKENPVIRFEIRR